MSMTSNRPSPFVFTNVRNEHFAILIPIYKKFLDYYYERYGNTLRGIKLDLLEIGNYIEKKLNEQNSVAFMATMATDPYFAVGFTLLSPVYLHETGTTQWNIDDMFVSTEYRRMGLATALLDQVREYCKTCGATSITLVTGRINIEARGAYEKYGFVQNNDYEDKQNIQYVLTIS
jgi:ribosomal protein S18 acetylase RimI-like enzyme